jgi:hypothetical protein
MRIVLVSSPGTGTTSHWSHASAAEVATLLAAMNAHVQWFAVMRPGQSPPAVGAVSRGAVEVQTCEMPVVPGVAKVAADNCHLPIEIVLTAALRAGPIHAVAHVGAGARGSPNIGWLADRLGVRSFAIARAAEVVCHRGDLVHRDGAPCTSFLDAERCRHCCTTSRWFGRPAADDFRNRNDLLAASLSVAEAVFVPAAVDRDQLLAFGVSERAVVIEAQAAAIAARLLATSPAP